MHFRPTKRGLVDSKFDGLLPARLLMLTLLCAPAAAQVSVGGSLEGIVRDRSTAAIVGARVILFNASTGLTRALTTDGKGYFLAGELPVGTYEVRVSKAGFATSVHGGITLSLGQRIRLNIQLAPAALVQRVNVTEQPSNLNPSETSVATLIDKERIEELPVKTRNALDFVLLAPGVAATNPQSAAAGQVPVGGSGFSFGGLRTGSNNLSIDGLDNNDEFSGGSRTELSPEIVREFQVINNGLSAEYGGASGGSINVVTRNGTNTPHGDAFVFLQTGDLNAREPISDVNEKPHLFRYRAGLSRGGALVKNRTFYYAGLEQEHIRTQDSSDIAPSLAEEINGFLSAGAFPRLPTRQITTGFFPVALSETEFSGKLDHQLNERNSLMLRYAFTNNKDAGEGFNISGLTDESARGSNFTEDNNLAGSLTSIFGSKAVNDLRFQFARRSVALRTNDQTGPGIAIDGFLAFGRPYAGNSRHREDHSEVTDTFARVHGSQLFKWGGTVSHIHIDSFAPDGFGALYIFPSVADFRAETPDMYLQSFGDPNTAFGVTNFGAFFQDHWSLTKQATIDLGVRYDFEHLPPAFNQDMHNFSPRVGFAYNPSNRWVVRAGYGIFFDRYILANLNRAIEDNGVQGFQQIADGPTAADSFEESQGGSPLEPAAGIQPSIFRSDPHLATSYSEQANLGVQFLLSKNLTASANYLFVHGVKLARTRNANLLPPVALTIQNAASLDVSDPTPQQIGRAVFGPGRLDPSFDAINLIEDSASSTYDGFSFSVNRQIEDFTISASYTLSKAIDDASGFAEQPQNPFALRNERALSLNDEPQRFVVSGLFDLPFGSDEDKQDQCPEKRSGALSRLLRNVELAPIITVGSGRPVDPLVGLDSNRSLAFPLSSRPLGFGRDIFRTSTTATVDLRVLKAIYFAPQKHLDLVVESFNLLNHTNVSLMNPFFGSGTSSIQGFGQPIDSFPARKVEFSIDFEY